MAATGTAEAALDVERVIAPLTYALRQAVLRPHQQLGEVAFDGDEDARAAHFVARRRGAIVAVASVMPELPHSGHLGPGSSDSVTDPLTASAHPALPGDWRLRGMATDAQWRGRGLGAALVAACAAHAVSQGGTALWCHARVSAKRFYLAQDFLELGPSFELPSIGPHVFMWRAL